MLKKIALIVLLSTTAALAQEKSIVYRMEYTVVETEGAKKLTSRTYTVMAEDRKRAIIRVGTRVPVRTSENQYNYMDVGVNLDAQPFSMPDAGTVRLDTTIDLTSIAASESTSTRPPVTRSCKDSVSTVIPLDKVVTLATQDDPSNNTTLQVQVIVKLVK